MMSYALTGKLVVMWNAVPVPVESWLPFDQTAAPPVDATAGVTGHVVGFTPFADVGSDDKNNTPTFDCAMPLAATGGQLPAFAVPSGTRPNAVASKVCPLRVIVTVLSSGQLFARNTAK